MDGKVLTAAELRQLPNVLAAHDVADGWRVVSRTGWWVRRRGDRIEVGRNGVPASLATAEVDDQEFLAVDDIPDLPGMVAHVMGRTRAQRCIAVAAISGRIGAGDTDGR